MLEVIELQECSLFMHQHFKENIDVGRGQLKLLDLNMDGSELFSPPADLLNLSHDGLLLFFPK